MTGYFGIPGTRNVTKVHAVYNESRLTLCNSPMRGAMEFQFCSSGFDKDYIECERCKRVLASLAALKRRSVK